MGSKDEKVASKEDKGTCNRSHVLCPSKFWRTLLSPNTALHHLRTYEVLTVSYIQPFMLHVWHEAYWRMITSGDNAFKKLLIWQAVTSCATFSSPFFAIALHQILWLFGWNLEPTFVMTSTTLSNPVAFSTILQKTKYLITASTSSIVFFVLTTRN